MSVTIQVNCKKEAKTKPAPHGISVIILLTKGTHGVQTRVQNTIFIIFSCGLNGYIFNNKNKKAFIVNLSKTKPLPIEFLAVQNKNVKIKVPPMEGFCVPKDAHFQFPNFCIKKKILRPQFLWKPNNRINKQIAATFLSSFPRILFQCRIFYIQKIRSWLQKGNAVSALLLKVRYADTKSIRQIIPFSYSFKRHKLSCALILWTLLLISLMQGTQLSCGEPVTWLSTWGQIANLSLPS